MAIGRGWLDSAASLSRWEALNCSSRASLSSVTCVARLALSLSRRCLNLRSFCSAVSLARRALSLSLLRRSLSSLSCEESGVLEVSILSSLFCALLIKAAYKTWEDSLQYTDMLCNVHGTDSPGARLDQGQVNGVNLAGTLFEGSLDSLS